MDPEGSERWRLEGYLPKDEFAAWLEMGLARVAFMKKDWAAAEMHLNDVISDHPESKFIPEAIYYKGVSRYSMVHDSAELAKTASTLNDKFAGSEWQLRSIPWLKEKSESTSG
jgi:outer membrane protein assembly factor BamD (BamD/ComL family)